MNKSMYELVFTKGSRASDEFLHELESLIKNQPCDFECSFIDLLNDSSANLLEYPTCTPRLTRIFPLPEEVFEGESKDIKTWIMKNKDAKKENES